eukprot:gene27-4278_t
MSHLRSGKKVSKTPGRKDEFRSLFGVSKKRKLEEEENEDGTPQLLSGKKLNFLKAFFQTDETVVENLCSFSKLLSKENSYPNEEITKHLVECLVKGVMKEEVYSTLMTLSTKFPPTEAPSMYYLMGSDELLESFKSKNDLIVRYYAEVFSMDLETAKNREGFLFAKFLAIVEGAKIFKFLEDLLSIIFDLVILNYNSNHSNFIHSLIKWIHIILVVCEDSAVTSENLDIHFKSLISNEKLNPEVLHWILNQLPNSKGKFRIINYFLEDFLQMDITNEYRSDFENFIYFLDKNCLDDETRNWEIFLILIKVLVDYFTEDLRNLKTKKKSDTQKSFKIFFKKIEKKVEFSGSKLVINHIKEFL